MRIQQKIASSKKIYKWKTGLISQGNGSKVVYLLAETNVALLKANFHLYVEHHVTWKVVFYSLTMKNKKEKKEALEIVIHLN